MDLIDGISTIKLEVGNWSVSLCLLDRPYPESPHKWDRNAVRAIVQINSPVIRAQLPTTIWSHELQALRQLFLSLREHIGQEESAQFELIEHVLSLRFELQCNGAIDVHCIVKDMDIDIDATLTFSLQADQSYLSIWIREVSNALASLSQEENPS